MKLINCLAGPILLYVLLVSSCRKVPYLTTRKPDSYAYSIEELK